MITVQNGLALRYVRHPVECGLFGVPGFRWVPAKKTVRVEYRAFVTASDSIPGEPPIA